MRFLIVRRQPVEIFEGGLTIPVPMSHQFDSCADAARWMVERGMQAECKVMPIQHFKALNGGLI